MSEELLKLRREMDRVLRKPGARPDRSTTLTRRTFLHKSVLTGAAATAGAAAYGWLPLINTLEVAGAQGAQPFCVASSDKRGAGKGCVRTCRSRWSPST